LAVETGNVTAFSSNFQGEAEERSIRNLRTDDQEVEAGNVYEVTFSSADMVGFQGTLELAEGLDLVDIAYANAEAGNFNLNHAANGLIAVSYNGAEGELFTLSLRASTNAMLSELINVSDRITFAEAYTNAGNITNLGINFGTTNVAAAEFGLEQNTPNPFAERTQIGFRLPVAGEATLTVQDVQGRTILVRQLEGAAGYNMVELTAAELGATGVLSYTIVAGDHTATRKLVVVR
ncbi:MAG: T9SS type A sorting domain-containing protein, partial [Bacteroidota bacterium]